MDVRIVGASAAVAAGLCALTGLAVVLFSPNTAPVEAPANGLLIARNGDASAVEPAARLNRLRARTPSSAIPSDLSVATLTPPATTSPTTVPPGVVPPSPPVAPPAAPAALAPTSPVVAVPGPSVPPTSPPNVQSPAPTLAPKPPPPRPVVNHKYDGVFTMDEIRKFKSAMRLSPDQEHFWGPVAGVLREIGRQQIAKIDAGQKPEIDMGMDMMQRFYSAASPLLETLREDQKALIRRRAKDMGLGAYASYI